MPLRLDEGNIHFSNPAQGSGRRNVLGKRQGHPIIAFDEPGGPIY